MRLINLELNGFKSFNKKTNLEFNAPIVAIVGPNGSGKSNVVESFRFVLGEQSMKSMRGKGGVDLIFKGSQFLSKSNRAVSTIYFDNKDRVFRLPNEGGEYVNLNFDTISISREVYSDGLNKYILNGEEVRLKDINNLLSSINIGSSGHHIISQGEADRILSSSFKEKRAIIEDALGLKIYQFKIKESERKLERSEENLKEVILLKRENIPHLNFLKKQIEKIEKIKELKTELSLFYKEYLKKQNIYLENEKNNLLPKREELKKQLEEITKVIKENEEENDKKDNEKLNELKKNEENLSSLRRIKGEIERKIGRLEGLIEASKIKKENQKEVKIFNQEEINYIIDEVNNYIDEALKIDSLEDIKKIIFNIKNIFNKFKSSDKLEDKEKENEILNLENSYKDILLELENINKEEEKISLIIRDLKDKINEELEESRDKEREKFTLRVKEQEINSNLSIIEVKIENLFKDIDLFNEEINEGKGLLGEEIFLYKDFEIVDIFNIEKQEELKRKIERIKIKLEDSGVGNIVDILKEYEEVNSRDIFLAKEIEDLNLSINSLKEIILDLKNKIDIEFKQGIEKINKEFQEFFSLMFGGGNAKIVIFKQEKKKNIMEDSLEELEAKFAEGESPDASLEAFREEEGIDIDVSLPHKKVKELHSLSGGERSLTSIALLFAMSSVNPPPFLILDETDAALDEANSRKYGDMLEKLSKHSQLIVVTHNRETMSRASILYGVTIDKDGASKLLSVKFEEAQVIAK